MERELTERELTERELTEREPRSASLSGERNRRRRRSAESLALLRKQR
jgi:hypothetical protein